MFIPVLQLCRLEISSGRVWGFGPFEVPEFLYPQRYEVTESSVIVQTNSMGSVAIIR